MPSDSRIAVPTLTSSTGGADSETRMVSPMPSASSAPKATADLTVPWKVGPASVTPRWSGIVAGLREQPVGLDHDHRVVVLDRNLDVAKVVLLEQRALPQGGLDEGLGGRLAVLGEQSLVERTGVDPDPDRRAGRRCRLCDLGDLVVERLDVARIDPDRRAAGIDRGEDVLGLEVNISDHRDLRLAGDRGERVGVVLTRDGDPHDLAPGRGELSDLLQGRVDVGRQGGGHRLHRHRGVSADLDSADVQLPADAALGQRLGRRGRHAEGDGYLGKARHEEDYLRRIGLTMSADASTTVNVAKIATTAYVAGSSLVRSTRLSGPR